MTKTKDRRFKDLPIRLTIEEIIEKRARAAKDKVRGSTRAMKRAKKALFMN
jgi:hypothetical protein